MVFGVPVHSPVVYDGLPVLPSEPRKAGVHCQPTANTPRSVKDATGGEVMASTNEILKKYEGDPAKQRKALEMNVLAYKSVAAREERKLQELKAQGVV